MTEEEKTELLAYLNSPEISILPYEDARPLIDEKVKKLTTEEIYDITGNFEESSQMNFILSGIARFRDSLERRAGTAIRKVNQSYREGLAEQEGPSTKPRNSSKTVRFSGDTPTPTTTQIL